MNNYEAKDERLKPCPFCGSDAMCYKEGNEHTKKQCAVVDCSKSGCFATQRVGILNGRGHDIEWAREQVFKRWNERL